MRKLPPLNAVRAFESAGRHLSFQLAAEELSVTPSAISHQVKALEVHLGARLFRRLTRRIELTETGRTYLRPLSEALDLIDEATRRTRASFDERVLTLTVAPTFATEWLVPRLLDFQDQHPDVEVRLATSLRLPDFRNSDVDLAVLLGPGDWEGLYVQRLTREDLVVVCTPAIAERLRSPAQLNEVSLLRVLARPGQWRSWLSAIGLGSIDVHARATVLDSTSLALEAAASGLGVALADRRLAGLYLDAGDLVVAFEVEQATDRGYHVVCPLSHLHRPAAQAFLEWLRTRLVPDPVAEPALLAAQPPSSSAAPVVDAPAPMGDSDDGSGPC